MASSSRTTIPPTALARETRASVVGDEVLVSVEGESVLGLGEDVGKVCGDDCSEAVGVNDVCMEETMEGGGGELTGV